MIHTIRKYTSFTNKQFRVHNLQNSILFSFSNASLDSFEKTIIHLACSYKVHGIYQIDSSNSKKLSELLTLDYNYFSFIFGSKEVFYPRKLITKFNNQYHAYNNQDEILFDCIVRFMFIWNNLKGLEHISSYKTLHDSYMAIIPEFELINAFSSTYELQHSTNIHDIHEFALYDSSSSFLPMDRINLLRSIILSPSLANDFEELIPIIQILLNYDFSTRSLALYLVIICQVFMHSSFLSGEVILIFRELYSHLLIVLRNARVISVSISDLYQDLCKPPIQRTKNTDETSRLQIVFCYDNFDAYSLRLDLAHLGINITHFNTSSPGGTKCHFFTCDEHSNILDQHPESYDFFIQYGSSWALKERSNLSLSSHQSQLYDTLCKQKEHSPVFSSRYSESSIINALSLLSRALPNEYHIPFDKQGIYLNYCFSYNKVVYLLNQYYIMYLNKDKEASLNFLCDIYAKAIKEELISTDDLDAFYSIDGLIMIVSLFKERLLHPCFLH